MKTKSSKKTTTPVAKTAKSKTAAALRDLPARKDARGGLKLGHEELKK